MPHASRGSVGRVGQADEASPFRAENGSPGPFGSPDGSRADLEEILHGFISFNGMGSWGGLATKQNDLTARVIVGRKGSGKTLYLRRSQAHASKDESLYADDIQQHLPSTSSIIKFCQLFNHDILTEKWMELWHVAILRSTVAHVLCHKHLRPHIPPDLVEKLSHDYSPLLRHFGTPVSVYSQVTEIIQQHHTENSIVRFLNDYRWEEIEHVLGDVIKDCPPICFFLDCVDEEFAHAPMYWMQCQKGLFYQTMRFLRDAKLGGRLHVVICIRDIVLSSVFRSEHQTRYRTEPHIRILNWNKEAISFFLKRKVEALPPECFMGNYEKRGKELTTFLGLKEIYNKARDTNELIENYLLRHTRLLPRDIVMLGNMLCAEIMRRKALSKRHGIPDRDRDDVIRAIVKQAASIFGNEQLQICANQIISGQIPEHASKHRTHEFYTDNSEYTNQVVDELKSLLGLIGTDRFRWADVATALDLCDKPSVNKPQTFSILWQNGLVGYVEKRHGEERITFYSEEALDHFLLPLDRDAYVFHSCLIDSVGLRSVGPKPIMPF